MNDKKVEEMVSELSDALTNLMAAEDKDMFAYWNKKLRDATKKISESRRTVRNKIWNRDRLKGYGRRGRPSKYETEEERKEAVKGYHHKYYLKTKSIANDQMEAKDEGQV